MARFTDATFGDRISTGDIIVIRDADNLMVRFFDLDRKTFIRIQACGANFEPSRDDFVIAGVDIIVNGKVEACVPLTPEVEIMVRILWGLPPGEPSNVANPV